MSLSRAFGTSNLKESVYTIVLDIEDLAIADLDMSELIKFLKEEVGGLVIDNSMDQFQFIQSCKTELFRNKTKEIDAINANKKKELLNLIGSNLFHFIPDEKKKAIAAAFANETIEEIHIKLAVPEPSNENHFKTFLPWEYMRCTTDFLEKEQVPNPKNLWLAGDEKIVFYRSLQKAILALPAAEQIKVLIIDTTNEQQVYKIFNKDEGKNIYERLQVNQEAVLFETLGREDGKYATRSNFIDSVSSIKPQIIHFVGTYGLNSDNQAVFSFFDKVGSIEKEEYSFELGAQSDYFEDWFIYNKTTQDRPRFYILQEGSSPKDDSHESLDQLAHILSSIGVPATCVIPYQSSYDFPLKSIYKNISNFKSIGKSVLDLRKRYLTSECHSLPILYLNQGDFHLLKEKIQVEEETVDNRKSEQIVNQEREEHLVQETGRNTDMPRPIGRQDTYSSRNRHQSQDLPTENILVNRFKENIDTLYRTILKIVDTSGPAVIGFEKHRDKFRTEIFNDIKKNKEKYQTLIPNHMDQLSEIDPMFDDWMDENGFTW